MITYIWYALLGLAGLAGVTSVAYFVSKRPWVGLVGVLAQLVVLAEFPNSFQLLTVAGFNVSCLDLTSAILLLAALLSRPRIVASPRLVVFCLLGAALTVQFIHGIALFGVGQSFTEFRQFFWAGGVLIWGMTLHWYSASWRRISTLILVISGWALVVVALAHFVQRGFGAAGVEIDTTSGESVDGRILVSGQALVMLLVIVVMLSSTHYFRPWIVGVSSVAFSSVLVLSEQRTVWLAAVGALATTLLNVRIVRGAAPLLPWFGVGALFAVLVLPVGLVSSALASSAQNDATSIARQEGWNALIGMLVHSGASAIIFGLPFGSGYVRAQSGTIVDFSPHNWYLNVALRGGILALSFYVMSIVSLAVSSVKMRRSTVVPAAITGVVIIYCWSYNLTWYLALFVALATSLTGSADARETTEDRAARRPESALYRNVIRRPVGDARTS